MESYLSGEKNFVKHQLPSCDVFA
ncbi:DUF5951 family protein [Kluyvera cryocrescens]